MKSRDELLTCSESLLYARPWAVGFTRVSCSTAFPGRPVSSYSYEIGMLRLLCDLPKVTQPLSNRVRIPKLVTLPQFACIDLVFPLSFLPSFSCKVRLAYDSSEESRGAWVARW